MGRQLTEIDRTSPGSNSERRMLPSYSSFLNIVEQAVSCLKAAFKARPEIQAQGNNTEKRGKTARYIVGQLSHTVSATSIGTQYRNYHGSRIWTMVLTGAG